MGRHEDCRGRQGWKEHKSGTFGKLHVVKAMGEEEAEEVFTQGT